MGNYSFKILILLNIIAKCSLILTKGGPNYYGTWGSGGPVYHDGPDYTVNNYHITNVNDNDTTNIHNNVNNIDNTTFNDNDTNWNSYSNNEHNNYNGDNANTSNDNNDYNNYNDGYGGNDGAYAGG